MMNLFKRGDKLIVKLINDHDTLEGEYVDGGENFLRLVNIESSKTQVVVNGPYIYYRSDISSVVKAKSESENKICESIDLNEESEEKDNSNVILIEEVEYERLKRMSQEYTYVTAMNSIYNSAIERLNGCDHIGLVGIFTGIGPSALLSLLCFSTWDRVYMFDFLTMNVEEFPSELKSILESRNVVKILHDSRLLTRVLNNRFNIELQNIFELKVADQVLRMENQQSPPMRSLIECLVDYFHFSATLLGSEETNLEKWKKRPLSDVRKFRAAQMVTYLHTLKMHLDDELFRDVYKGCCSYSHSLESCILSQMADSVLDNKLCNTLRQLEVKY